MPRTFCSGAPSWRIISDLLFSVDGGWLHMICHDRKDRTTQWVCHATALTSWNTQLTELRIGRHACNSFTHFYLTFARWSNQHRLEWDEYGAAGSSSEYTIRQVIPKEALSIPMNGSQPDMIFHRAFNVSPLLGNVFSLGLTFIFLRLDQALLIYFVPEILEQVQNK